MTDSPKSIPQIIMVAVTTKDYGKTIVALKKSLEKIKPAATYLLSDVPFEDEEKQIQHILIDRFKSVEDYNHFIFKKLYLAIPDFCGASHILIVQHDGYVIESSAWTDEFINYDYIGAPWTYTDGRNVGNGGFSLRSKRLHFILQQNEFEFDSPEDEKICRYYRQTLEKKYSIRFAPESLAHKFSFEMHRPAQKTFGFHNYFHPPYQEPIILKRTGAMGDIIMLEPVMEHFNNLGYRVILDTQPMYYNLFAKHYFSIELRQNVNPAELQNAREIDFDMGYEVEPRKLILEQYYKVAGIENGVLRNSRLQFAVPADRSQVKLFDKYVIFHTDDTEMPHRNVHGVDWNLVADYIESILGYPVFRVGRGNGSGGQKINTYSENMLAYIVANANYFIGLDSGVAQIAVACGVPSMIFFGSVNPAYRYFDLSGIKVMQKACPIGKDSCYHEVISVVGQDCQVDVLDPPCIHWNAEEINKQLINWIK